MTKSIMLLVTYRCNLRCTYCYEPKLATKDMDIGDAKRHIAAAVADLREPYDSFEVQLMGGEPLLRFDLIRELADWIWAQPWPVPLRSLFAVTNGTLLTDDHKQWLARNRHRICLGLSFDGDFEMQNANRSDSARQVDLEFFKDTWPEQQVKMTLSPATLPRMAQGVEYLHSVGFGNITAELALGPRVRWTDHDAAVLRSQLTELSQFYLDHPQLRPFSLLRLDIFDLADGNDCSKRCGCGESLVCIDTDGTRYACHLFAPISCPGPRARASLDIDFGDHSLFVTPECQKCPLSRLCPSCYGMNYCLTGRVAIKDPFTCQAFKITYLVNLRFAMARAERTHDHQLQQRITALINDGERRKK